MIWPLTWLVQLWHIMIWPLMWLVQLWKVPRKTPLLAYINQELTTIKWNCLDRTHLIVSRSRRVWVGGQQAHFSSGPLSSAEGSSTAPLFLRSAPSNMVLGYGKWWTPQGRCRQSLQTFSPTENAQRKPVWEPHNEIVHSNENDLQFHKTITQMNLTNKTLNERICNKEHTIRSHLCKI